MKTLKAEFNKQEIYFLMSLVEAEKESRNLLTGFRKPNKEEQDKNAYCDALTDKLNKLKKYGKKN